MKGSRNQVNPRNTRVLEHIIQRMSAPLQNIQKRHYLGPYLIQRRWNSYLAEPCQSPSIFIFCLLPPTCLYMQGLMALDSEPQQAWEAIIMRGDNDSNDKKINGRKGASADGIRVLSGWASPPWWRLLSALLGLNSFLSLVVCAGAAGLIGEAVRHT